MNVKKIIFFIFWLIIFVGVIFVVIRAGNVQNKKACEKYTIKLIVEDGSDTLLYVTDIEKILLEHDNIIGKTYNEIDIYKLEQALKNNPYVSSAVIYGDLSGELRITVIQRTPLFRVINNNKEQFYIDKSGHSIPTRLNMPAHVMTINGNIDITYEQAHSDTLQKKVKDMLNCIELINSDPFLNQLIGQIYVDATGQYIFIPVIGNYFIILGHPQRPETRLEKLKYFYQKGPNASDLNQYASIDLRFKNQIVCKKI